MVVEAADGNAGGTAHIIDRHIFITVLFDELDRRFKNSVFDLLASDLPRQFDIVFHGTSLFKQISLIRIYRIHSKIQ